MKRKIYKRKTYKRKTYKRKTYKPKTYKRKPKTVYRTRTKYRVPAKVKQMVMSDREQIRALKAFLKKNVKPSSVGHDIDYNNLVKPPLAALGRKVFEDILREI